MSSDINRLLERRSSLLGPAYRLFYPKDPMYVVRARDVHVWDSEGRQYLDTYNNVPHVGHCHPRVVEAVSRQLAQCNLHTRYIHHAVLDYAERLLATFEPGLDVCQFGCSGTEANELALRLARSHTGNRGVIVTECAYHGHSQSIYEISTRDIPGELLPGYVVTVPAPDDRRGRYRGSDAAERYLSHVDTAIEVLAERGFGVAAMIVDTVQSAGGTIVPPPGYYRGAAERVRRAGGLFIADEVQAGLARMGTGYWAYQDHGLVPDFVTMGKSIGNGMPVSACVTRRELVEKFAATHRYFNTFAGIPATTAAGLAVLEVLEDERLAERAAQVGAYLKTGLARLAGKHQCLGDIRGHGFFIGLDIVRNRESQQPDPQLAERIIYEMKRRGVLSGAIGPAMNTLKIRPPMTFTQSHADLALSVLDETLATLT